ncbi:peptidoglycan glycosyltransferase [Kribbella sp. ALI-6-A]|uniref:peptidoglycan D,D-transpeptidase FtsI family protein n=1 Tax=Kribbella sp. ALI-6-A TaxID=1933817 RepID=UPI00097C2B85|nr:penicillin-binding protein 2 [Kribbella sp. ALI-6-A]ONI69735.1 peptidoglycan glycosyltransferase [Kribbella sp. ALI-6-A]
MTERRGDEPPRKRGEPGRGNPPRKAPSSRRPATESGRPAAQRPRRPAPDERKRREPRQREDQPRRRPVEPRRTRDEQEAPRRATKKTAASRPRKSADSARRVGPDGRPQARKVGPDGRPLAKKTAAPRKRPPQNRRPPRKPRPKKPPRLLKLGRPTLRLRATFVVMAFVLSLFAGRLVMLQGVDPDRYAAAAVRENTKPFVLHASRGSILDRNGVPLSVSEDAVAITADPTQTAKIASQLAGVLAPRLSSTDYATLMKKLTGKGRYVVLANQVSPQTWNQITDEIKRRNTAIKDQNKGLPKDQHKPLLAGLYTEADPVRSHPNGTIAANVVGVVGAEGKGLAGLEYGLNDKLSGQDGKAMYEVDAKGNKIPNADHTVEEPKPGLTAQLTLDADLQWFAERRIEQAVKQWKASSGTVVVMDTKTGEIPVMANYPSFDPNKPVKTSALKNRALEQVYEPGSVQKVVTMAALADAGLISLDTKLKVPGSYTVQRRTIRDHFDHGVLNLTMAGVIAKSSNVGTIMAAQQMPVTDFVHYLKKFGFGEPTGIDFPGESRGLMPPGDEWSELTRSNVAFGQGLSANAVQMAAAVNAVANGGVYMPPKLVKNWIDADGNVTPNKAAEPRRVVSESAAKQVSTMMEAVTADNGTAPQAAIAGYRVAGKTGTAQQVDSACGCYRKWATSFSGFAPADNPRFVTYVVLQDPTNGRGGGFQGGPVFRDVMSYALQKYAVPPTGAKQPNVPITW